MTRKTFWDILDEYEFDSTSEFIELLKIFAWEIEVRYRISLSEFIYRETFQDFKCRKRFTNLYQYIDHIMGFVIIKKEDGNIFLLPNTKEIEISIEALFTFTELLLALLDANNYYEGHNNHFNDDIYSDYFHIIERLLHNINNFLELTTHEVVEIKSGRRIIISKSASTTQAAEIVSDSSQEISKAILEYKHFSNKNNIGEKKRILVKLAHFIENDIKSQPKKDLKKDLGFLLNNFDIRHNNSEKTEATVKMSELNDEKVEEIYDMTYNSILTLIINQEQERIHERIKELKPS